MKKMGKQLLILGGLFLMSSGLVQAGNLDQVMVRLESIKTSESPIPILVTVKTNTDTVENGFQLTVGSGWQVDESVANIMIVNNNLPAGVTSWPGIGVAEVSGQLIKFGSENLNKDVTYGFYITAGIGVNPNSGDGVEYKWLLETLSNNVVADSTEIKVAVVESDKITITGRVGANASDFQLGLTSSNTGEIKLGEEVTYQVDYGSYLHNSTKPMKISVEWSRGTVEGSPSPSVDILDYVIGSASTAWGDITPVVDLVNRKIVWTVNSFPANTINEQLFFKLRVNDAYSGSSRVNFEVKAVMEAANVVTIEDAVQQVYVPDEVGPTLTPTPRLTATPGPTSVQLTATPTVGVLVGATTPAIIVKPIKIVKVDIVGLSSESVIIGVELNQIPKELKIKYGVAVNQINKSIISLNKLVKDRVQIDGLKPGTDYFFRLEVQNVDGKAVGSEIFLFRTATENIQAVVDKNSLVVSTANSVLLNANSEIEKDNSVVLVPNLDYALRLSVKNSETVKLVKVLVRDTKVLGITSIYGAEPNSKSVDLSEVIAGGYIGKLVSPKTTGFYEIVARIEDVNGNINEEKIGELRVVNPLLIVDSDNLPVEGAKVLFSRFNIKNRVYELMSTESYGIKNPSFSEPNGAVKITIPKGKYRVEVTGIGFVKQEVDFELGWGEAEILPKIILQKTNVGWWQKINYLGIIGLDVFNFSNIYVKDLTASGRFFELLQVLIIITGVVMGWWYVSMKQKIEWWMLPIKLWDFGKLKLLKIKLGELRGKVIDELTGKPIAGVEVYLLDKMRNKVLSKSLSNELGVFEMEIKPAKAYKVAAVKSGYEATPMYEFTVEGILANDLVIKMENEISTEEKIVHNLGKWTEMVVVILISAWILVLLGLELIFWNNFGMGKTWWGVIVSWLNTICWLTIILQTKNK